MPDTPRLESEPLVGTIYLLCFDSPLHHFRHYLGWTQNLDRRLDRHRRGRGARLTRRLRDAGIAFTLVRTWTGTRHDERRMKQSGHGRRCPRCRKGVIAA